jgi:hypothetical protein
MAAFAQLLRFPGFRQGVVEKARRAGLRSSSPLDFPELFCGDSIVVAVHGLLGPDQGFDVEYSERRWIVLSFRAEI